MTDDLFNSLALAVLSGKASPAENQELDRLCAADPSLAREFKEMKETFALLQASLPLEEAKGAPATPLPAYRLQELRSAVRREFPARNEPSGHPWWKPAWIPSYSYAGCGLALLLLAGVLLNHRSGIEFGTYQDAVMRDGRPTKEWKDVSVQAFSSDRTFQSWQAGRFGPRFRIWLDEAEDRIVVVEPGGFFSKNRTNSYPLPENAAEREELIRRIIANLKPGH